MSIRLRQVAAGQIAIALHQSRLVRFERLPNSVDEHGLGSAGSFERIARPDHHIRSAARRQAADLAAHADRLRWPRSDHRERLAPAYAGGTRYALQRHEVGGVLPLPEDIAGIA